MEETRKRLKGGNKEWDYIVSLIHQIGVKDFHRALSAEGSHIMQLVRETLDGEGNVKWQTFARQNTDLGDTEGMILKAISRNVANGQKW